MLAPSGGQFMPAGLRKFSTSGCSTLSISQSPAPVEAGCAGPPPFRRRSSPTSFSVDSPRALSCRSWVLARFSRALSCTTETTSSTSTPPESAMPIVLALAVFMVTSRRTVTSSSCFERPVTPDQLVGRTVVGELGLRILELGDDALREHFAELDAPLVERVHIPDHALHEHLVF